MYGHAISLKYFHESDLCFFLPTNQKGDTHATSLKGKTFHANFRCAWKGRGLELFTPIASNKNGWESNKNLEVMTKAIGPNSLDNQLGQ